MKDIVKIAWRNLWRNKTRTVITAVVVFIGVILAAVMSSQQYGIYDTMIDNVIGFSGNIQVLNEDYWENKTINNSLEYSDSLTSLIGATDHVSLVTPRLESFALASNGDITKGILVAGIDAEKEDELNNYSQKIVRFKITEEVLENIQRENPGKEIIQSLASLKGRSFISDERLEANIEDLFDKKQEEKVLALMKKYSRYPGSKFEKNDNGVILGERLAEYLQLDINDTLVLISQGYHGVSAAGLYPVKGLVKIPSPDLERRLVYMEINTCMEFYSTENRVTSLVVKVDRNSKTMKALEGLKAKLPEGYTAMSWQETQPEMVNMIEGDKAGGYFMKGIFYIIVGFIIFSTIMMMMAERKREFGIMIAVGMQKLRLSLIVFFETLFIGIIGSVFGLLASIPLLSFLKHNPIPLQGDMAKMMEDFGFEAVLYFSNNADIFYWQPLIIFIMVMIIFIFPIYIIRKLKIMNAIRG